MNENQPQIQLAVYKGNVEKIIFRNDADSYYIAVIRFDGDDRASKMKGQMPGLHEDARVEVSGYWESNARFGATFNVKSCRELLPADIKGINAYLSSGLVKGIGPEYASRIVAAFGLATFDVLDNHPERLAEVDGIGPKRAASIIAALAEQKGVRDIMLYLKSIGVSNTLAAKIFKTLGDSAVARIRQNPYLLVDEIKGVGFKKADEIAEQSGIDRDSPFRLRSAALFVLQTAVGEGHTFLPIDELSKRAVSDDVTGLGEKFLPRIHDAVMELCKEQKLVVNGDDVYFPTYYYSEKGVASRVLDLMTENEDLSGRLVSFEGLEDAAGCEYSQEQKAAIRTALREPVTILTGGPGTGKTTVTRGIIGAFEVLGLKVSLAAPTGRAAKRMTESTGRPASTIHRLLEYGKEGFGRNEDLPLTCDALVVDESSMVDILLMNSLLKAITPMTKLVFVGDIDQLPSVGAGNVLKDMIESGSVPTVRLTHIFRQAAESAIIQNAYAINSGAAPQTSTPVGSDYVFYNSKRLPRPEGLSEDEYKESELMRDWIVKLVTKDIPRKRGFKVSEIQVLTPMRRNWDPIGAIQLNNALQAAINPDGEPIKRAYGLEFREGDRVMQIKNNYDNDVFNGDTGTITRVDREADELWVDFGTGTEIRYERAAFGELDLAYATTVHKSQGSEYPAVVIPIHKSQFLLLQRQLLYTAVTRAKKLCFVIGDPAAVMMAVRNQPSDNRYTRLRELLRENPANENDEW